MAPDPKQAGRRDCSGIQTKVFLAASVGGFVGLALVVLGVAQPGSSFTSKIPGSWIFGVPSSADGARQSEWIGLVLVYGGLLVLLTSWYLLLMVTRRSTGRPLRHLYAVLAGWLLPLLAAPPLFSRDVYSYAAQGRLVSRGLSPYTHGLQTLKGTSFFNLADPLWRSGHAPYGPVFFDLARWNAALGGRDVFATVEGYRVMAVIGIVLVAVSIPALATSLGSDGSAGFILAVLNPAVLLYLVGGAHNDALMLGLLVAGMALALSDHPISGLFLCALAAAIKIPALIGIVYIGWTWPGRRVAVVRRLGYLAGSLALSAGFVALLSLASGLGWGWLFNLSSAGGVTSWLDPASAAGLGLSHGLHLVGTAVDTQALVTISRTVALVVAGIVGIVLLTNVDRIGVARAMGWSLLTVVFLGPIIWPWYEAWGMVFLALATDKWSRRVVVVLGSVACFATVPSGLSLSPAELAGTVSIVLVLVVGLIAALGLARRVLPTGQG